MKRKRARCNNLAFDSFVRLIRLIFLSMFLLFSLPYLFVNSESVLGIGDATWTNYGYPRWQLLLCLAFSWFVAFLCLSKGIKSAGKTVFFMVLFPYVILTALLVSTIDFSISYRFDFEYNAIQIISFITDSKFDFRRCMERNKILHIS